jgi:hypothetical protein
LTGKNFGFGANANLLPVSHILENKTVGPTELQIHLNFLPGEHKMDGTLRALWQ